MKWPIIAHPLLFAAFPILAAYQHNLGQISPQELGRPLAVVLAATFVLWGLLVLLCRNAVKAGIIVSLFWVLFFSFGPVREVLMQVPNEVLAMVAEDSTALLRFWVIFFLSISALCLASRRSFAPLNAYLNVVAVLLILMPLYHLARPLAFPIRTAAATAVTRPSAAADTAALPNIFYIVLDAYAREDILREMYNYDNRSFLNHLTRLGFQVARRSNANYAQTFLTLGSSLNMCHIDELLSEQQRQTNHLSFLLPHIAQSGVATFLQSQGYKTVSIGTGHMAEHLFTTDRTILLDKAERLLTDFEWMLLETTVLVDLPINDDLYTNAFDLHWRRVRHAFNHLDDMAEGEGPIFGLAHIVCPHPPFIFNSLGGYIPPDPNVARGQFVDMWEGVDDQDSYLKMYPQQLAYTSTAVRGALHRLIARSRRPTVIILLSDHGPTGIMGGANMARLTHPTVKGYRERMGNLCAVYTSDGPLPGLSDTITPVNLFPLVLNHYFHTDVPLKEDASYFSSYKYPYRFIDVTALIK